MRKARSVWSFVTVFFAASLTLAQDACPDLRGEYLCRNREGMVIQAFVWEELQNGRRLLGMRLGESVTFYPMNASHDLSEKISIKGTCRESREVIAEATHSDFPGQKSVRSLSQEGSGLIVKTSYNGGPFIIEFGCAELVSIRWE